MRDSKVLQRPPEAWVGLDVPPALFDMRQRLGRAHAVLGDEVGDAERR